MDISTGQTPAQVTCAHCQRSRTSASAPRPAPAAPKCPREPHIIQRISGPSTPHRALLLADPASVPASRPSRSAGRESYSTLRIRQPSSSPPPTRPVAISACTSAGRALCRCTNKMGRGAEKIFRLSAAITFSLPPDLKARFARLMARRAPSPRAQGEGTGAAVTLQSIARGRRCACRPRALLRSRARIRAAHPR